MSTIVYHHQQGINLQPCFEMTTTLKLKVALPPPSPPPLDCGGWSFLQSLSGNLAEKETITAAYVHPLERLSNSPRLSEKSLSLCTEPLGSETGSDDIGESSIFPGLSSHGSTLKFKYDLADGQTDSTRVAKANRCNKSKCSPKTNSFPPPLTTISGANSIKVRPHREGGRLIITAAVAPQKNSYLQADRSDGRLRLCFVNDSDGEASFEETNDGYCKNDEINGEDEAEDDDEVYAGSGGDMDENTMEVEVEMGKKKCLLGRCKEGGHSNKGLCHWGKSLCVTT